MDKKIFRKMPRREANYLSLQEWIKKKKIPRKLNDDVSILTHQYRQGNILNINTAKNEINKLISTTKPKEVFYNTLKKYAITHPLVSRNQAIRLNKVTRSIERVLQNIEMKRLKTVIVNFLLFKPVSDDHDFKATGERRYKHSDGSLWAQIGSVYQITISVNESDIQTLYTLLNDFVTAEMDQFQEGMIFLEETILSKTNMTL